VVQIMGKVRDRFWVPVDISEEDLKARALELEKIKEQIQGKNIVKIIVVPQKLINIVAK
jgi:leucyl-tRNA synthetase